MTPHVVADEDHVGGQRLYPAEIPLLIREALGVNRAVPCVDRDRNAGQSRRQGCVMMDAGVMAVHDVRAIAAEASGHGKHRARRKSRRFAERHHRNARGFEAPGERSSLKKTINDHLMAGLPLGDGKIHRHTLQPSQFQILD